MRTTLKSLICSIAVLLGVFVSQADAWWNSDFTIRKKITIDTSTAGTPIADQIGTVAVLLRLHDGNFHFEAAKEDGSDIRFVAADEKTPLSYHIEKYDGLLNEAFVWVKVPDVKPGSQTSFWMYYGNQKAAQAQDPKGTYDVQTSLVYHFAENNAPPHDSTTYGNNAQSPAVSVSGALIGPGARFDGQATVTIPSSESLTWTDNAAVTWSAWIKPVAAQPNAILFARRDNGKSFVVGVDNGIPFVEITDANGTQRTQGGPTLTANAWRHIAVVGSGSKTTLYLDGDQAGNVAAGIPGLASAATLGGDNGATGFIGELDELQIAKAARPVGFIKVEALNQGTDKGGKLLTLANDEQRHSWFSGGFIGIILGSLTVDGWIVIGILIVMSAISWLVMVQKSRYLRAVSLGNEEFLNEWDHIAADLGFLDGDVKTVSTLGGRIRGEHQKAVRHASVYRIFKCGAEEIRHRLASDKSGNAKTLSARSIQAIRASLDGALVRESQKLNRQMVLLTIAISGGPFLGLLGTVVGVMITFAAIAAQGDVNVNAIAPGIAAALAATVAGLAVAIPALFGYNYLLSQVKDATSDMQVFIDEFITKMAEYYDGRPATSSRPARFQSEVEMAIS